MVKETEQKLREKDKLIQQKDKEIIQKDKIIQQKDEEIVQKEQECQQKHEIIKRKDEEIRKKDKIIEQKEHEIEEVHKQYHEAGSQLKELKLQKENGKAESELNHAETPSVKSNQNKLRHTGTQTTGNESKGEAKEMFQHIEKEKPIKSQQISNKNEQISITVKTNGSLNYQDVKGENGEHRIKAVKPADKQLELKRKQIDTGLCSAENLSDHVIDNMPLSALVTLKNNQGKPVMNCSDSITVRIQPNKCSYVMDPLIDITEKGNGRYEVSFIITEAGDYRLFILVNNQSIITPPHR